MSEVPLFCMRNVKGVEPHGAGGGGIGCRSGEGR